MKQTKYRVKKVIYTDDRGSRYYIEFRRWWSPFWKQYRVVSLRGIAELLWWGALDGALYTARNLRLSELKVKSEVDPKVEYVEYFPL
ncbi:hypothetical protein LCGC14_0146350 [marine sediment metagenome]|uniref:Uncharacterized protein n=1 Tax=marine sediment metagenome TaxID=412755 RepID=A0A0F9V3G1_9ZZZZ